MQPAGPPSVPSRGHPDDLDSAAFHFQPQVPCMPSSAERRLVILAEGNFGFHHGKTAMGVIRFGTDKVLAVIDSTQAGRNVREWLGDSGRYDIPIVASLSDALGFLPRANGLLIGIAPTGGRLPDSWRQVIHAAIRAGLDIHSGLHTFLGDDPEFVDAARTFGVRLIDYRRAPERMETAVGRRHGPGKRVILTVGTDCAIGKMSVALELRRAAVAAGRSASFVPTGQTGMMIEGWGVAVDRVIADFVQGSAEWLAEEGERRGDWVIVEGQGSLDHPAYSSVTLALIHGTTPHAMVMVHKPGMADHDFDHLPGLHFPIAPLPPFIALHEQVAGLVAPSKVVAVALNTSLIHDEAEARRIIAATGEETGLPCDDPVRFGGEGLWRSIEAAVDGLSWVTLPEEDEGGGMGG
jgi:uncharacterized NAD-dependent epimerase/dehydratase family protein